MGEYVIGIIGPFWNPLTFFLSSVSFFKFIFVSQVSVIVCHLGKGSFFPGYVFCLRKSRIHTRLLSREPLLLIFIFMQTNNGDFTGYIGLEEFEVYINLVC